MASNRVSVVVPAFNEAANLPRLVERVLQALHEFPDREIIVVDDGSTDDTMDTLRTLGQQHPEVRYLSLTRNFGHQPALKAGLDASSGDCVISLDADLQHPPELIPRMIELWRAGIEVVCMVRSTDGGGALKRMTSRFFYRFANALSDQRVEPGGSDFRLLDRRVVETIRALPERSLFFRGTIPWLGFSQCNVPYTPGDRSKGGSKYDVRRMVDLGLRGITSTSMRPLHLATMLGAVMFAGSMVYVCYALVIKFVAGTAISGWTSLLVSVLLIGGMQLLMLGIIGEYLGRVLLEVRARPQYVVREHNLPPPASGPGQPAAPSVSATASASQTIERAPP